MMANLLFLVGIATAILYGDRVRCTNWDDYRWVVVVKNILASLACMWIVKNIGEGIATNIGSSLIIGLCVISYIESYPTWKCGAPRSALKRPEEVHT